MNDRYKGNSFLRVLECYALRAIDKLTNENELTLREMTPHLRQTFNVDGDWCKIVEQVMDFPTDMPEKIKAIWLKNQELASTNNEELQPQHFAELFIDRNFSPPPTE